jgi:large subunit ribosomal protein L23
MALFGRKKKEEKKEIEPVETAEVKDTASASKQEKEELKPTAQMPKGGDEHAYGVILSPHLTEKSSLLAALNKYVFKVAKNSGKTDIKKAIEKMYKVKVAKVAISFGRSKARKVGKYEGEKTGFKKAIVTLVEGDKIDIIS